MADDWIITPTVLGDQEMVFLRQYGFSPLPKVPFDIAIDQKDYTRVEHFLKNGLKNGVPPQRWRMEKAANISRKMTELFLDYGAQASDIPSKILVTGPFVEMMWRRRRCKRAAAALCRVLRKRYLIHGWYKLPKELVEQMARGVWDLRRKSEWLE